MHDDAAVPIQFFEEFERHVVVMMFGKVPQGILKSKAPFAFGQVYGTVRRVVHVWVKGHVRRHIGGNTFQDGSMERLDQR